MQIKIKLLEYNEGTYQGNPYASVVARYNDKLLKFKVDPKKVGNLQALLDNDITATIELINGGNMVATARIVRVEEVR